MIIESIRTHSNAWWFRAFLALLAFTFAFLWYGNDIMTGSRSNSIGNLASVGGTKITFQDFAQEYQREVGRISQIQEAPLSPQEQEMLYPYVLQNLIQNALLQREAQRLNLIVSDHIIRYTLHKEKNLQKEDGTFDRQKFNHFLQNSNQREKVFIDILRQDLLRAHIAQSLFGGVNMPQIMALRMFYYEHQRRRVHVVHIESQKLKLKKNPELAQIYDYFIKNPAKFIAPERRDISGIIFTAQLFEKDIKISDSTLRQDFESRSDEFKGKSFELVKEGLYKDHVKRELDLKLQDITTKIEDALARGATIEEISQTYGWKVKYFKEVTAKGEFSTQIHENITKKDNSTIMKNSLPTQDEYLLIKEAFKDKADDSTKLSEISEGKFILFQITKTHPSRPLTFDDAKTIARDLYIQHMKEEQAKLIAIKIESQTLRGGLFASLLQQENLKGSHLRISRAGPLGPTSITLPKEFIGSLYNLPLRGAKVHALKNEQGEQDFLIGYVEEIEPAKLKDREDDVLAYRKRFKDTLVNDLYQQYILSLKRSYPVEYNQKALGKLTRTQKTKG